MKDKLKPYRDTDSGRFATVVVFECRGLEPVDFSPRVSTGTDTLTLSLRLRYLEEVFKDKMTVFFKPI
jgi:hypothetical protein